MGNSERREGKGDHGQEVTKQDKSLAEYLVLSQVLLMGTQRHRPLGM